MPIRQNSSYQKAITWQIQKYLLWVKTAIAISYTLLLNAIIIGIDMSFQSIVWDNIKYIIWFPDVSYVINIAG